MKESANESVVQIPACLFDPLPGRPPCGNDLAPERAQQAEEAGVIYVFDDAYLFNKEQIEASSGFDRAKFYDRLYDELTAEGCHFRRDFHLDDYWVDEGYCLYEEGEFWVVAYVDRGRRLSPAFFVHPEDAEMFFRAKLKAMPLENQGSEWLPPLGWRPEKK